MYKFDPRGGTVEQRFRAIAIDQLDEALADLDQPDSEDRSVVHEARRRCKRLRGLLRVGFSNYALENAEIRSAATMLSHLRDAKALRQRVAGLDR